MCFIYVLDDDIDELYYIEVLLQKSRITNYKLFTSAEMFIEALDVGMSICIIDYFLSHGITGLDVIKKVIQKTPHCYFIFVSGQMSLKIATEFNWLVLKGRFIEKNDPDFDERLISCIKAVMIDIIFLVETKKLIDRQLDEIKNILNKEIDP